MQTKFIIALAASFLLGITGCALRPGWHWEKTGADDQALSWDQNQCKAKIYSGSAGEVTNETVRRMFACMEGKGWSRAAN